MKEIVKSDTINAVKVAQRPSEITSSALRAKVAEMLLHNASKSEIFEYLEREFPNKVPSWYTTAYRQGYVYLYQYCEFTKEEIRNTSLARLEAIFSELEDDEEMTKKDRINCALKTIDSINKTACLYTPDTNVKVDGDGSFVVSIGNQKIFDK